ncbi:NAD-dependent epimerase/dehydratase family protein [Microvirga sp. W0021]|uniref:NAD-dependent epimerase/dehydratase family protein n=1 Tax=Hohaiivirga grylli TaxID=3133970 RepID=A0ABV0BFA6_9HYPH
MPNRIASGGLIALTGATGFIGQFLLKDMIRRGYRVRVLLRRPVNLHLEADSAIIGDLTHPQNMAEALQGVDAVIHSAGLAHAMSGMPEADYRAINTDATANLAQAAEKAGVRRFIFLSSIRAQSGPVSPTIIHDTSPALPTDAYGRSKLAAEQALAQTNIDWAALRPVLVYGNGVKGNMATLARLARSQWHLPLGGIQAKRSLLSVENLADAIDFLLRTEKPLRQSMIVADNEPLTIGEMIAAMRSGLNRPAGLIPVPEFLLKLGCRALGKQEAFERIAGSLVVDASTLRELGWQPPITTQSALAEMSKHFASDA